MIPFKRLPIGEADIASVTETLRSGNISMGKKVKEFEERLAEYVGAPYVVAVDSCTSALFLSMKVFGIGRGSTVRIPSMTVPLVPNTVIHTGASIEFRDECEWVGHSYFLEPFPIIDSAHKVSKGQYQKGTLLCFSFYPTKPISSCEGGAICLDNPVIAEWLRRARFYGRNSGNTIAKNSWEYDIDFPGWKMNMTDIQASLCLEQLKILPDLDRKRKRASDYYNNELGENNSSMYLYRINVNKRDEFIPWMKEKGVECGVHFKPLHHMKAFKDCLRRDLTKTEEMAKTTVSLPLYDSLSFEDADYIINLVKEWRAKNG